MYRIILTQTDFLLAPFGYYVSYQVFIISSHNLHMAFGIDVMYRIWFASTR